MKQELVKLTQTHNYNGNTSSERSCLWTRAAWLTYHDGVTGPLGGECTGHGWISLAKASDAELWYFLWFAPEQTVQQTMETPRRSSWRHCSALHEKINWFSILWSYDIMFSYNTLVQKYTAILNLDNPGEYFAYKHMKQWKRTLVPITISINLCISPSCPPLYAMTYIWHLKVLEPGSKGRRRLWCSRWSVYSHGYQASDEVPNKMSRLVYWLSYWDDTFRLKDKYFIPRKWCSYLLCFVVVRWWPILYPSGPLFTKRTDVLPQDLVCATDICLCQWNLNCFWLRKL